MKDRIDLGHNQSYSRLLRGEVWIGILEWHPCKDPDGVPSAGGVYFENAPAEIEGPRWKLESEAPLTISPSIACRVCGNHGWIREGRWIPA